LKNHLYTFFEKKNHLYILFGKKNICAYFWKKNIEKSFVHAFLKNH